MGRHSAGKLPVRGRHLRSAYTRLLHAYGRLLRDHRRLEAEHRELLERTTPDEAQPPVRRRQTTWGAAREAMDVERASELVRESGLLTSAGG